ncbi:hypothetical protein, partial [Baaleninema sp.]|uniref:hypothetical protein n=1 Tax=Baaleninema sp. TaxID=3101197 RepID=UPI003D070118
MKIILFSLVSIAASAMTASADSIESRQFPNEATNYLSQNYRSTREIVGTVRSIRDNDEFVLETENGTV